MRGNTLGTLIQMLRREMKIAESPSLGKNTRETHAHALRSAQDRLYQVHDWPFKIVRRDILLKAGQRYYAPPTDMKLEGIRNISYLYSGQWCPLARGIGALEYNQINSDAGGRNDPVLRWEIYNDPDNGDMLEVWPVPATDDICTIRLEGVRTLSALVADADRADLDDLAIVLTAAADLAPTRETAKAAGKADKHVFSLTRNLSNGRTFISGGGRDPHDHRRPPRIIITPASGG